MDTFIEKCLEDIESRIMPEVEEELYQQWVDFLEGKYEGQIFSPRRQEISKPGFNWIYEAKKHYPGMIYGLNDIPINLAIENFDLMVLQQFFEVSNRLSNAEGVLMDIRCNYGTSIIPSLFGAELYPMADELNTLPTNRPLNNVEKIKQIILDDVPELKGGLAEKVFTLAQEYKRIALQYPKIGKYVNIFHPDAQGVIDICELLWGSGIFVAFYEMTELVKQLMDLIANTYVKFIDQWDHIVPFDENYNTHWGYLHKGKIMLRCDSAMNISPTMYEEFIFPHQRRIFQRYGGALHFCGRGDHYLDKASSINNLHSVQMTQPEYNDIEKIYAATVDKGKTLLGLNPSVGADSVKKGRQLHGLVHCNETEF